MDELGAEGGAADTDHEEVFEFALGAGDGAGVDARGEVFDRSERGGNLGGEGGRGRELGRAEPVVADHAVLIGIGDGAFFQGGHVGEGLLHRGVFGGEKIVGERDAADVEREAEIGVVIIKRFKAGPGGHGEGKGKGS